MRRLVGATLILSTIFGGEAVATDVNADMARFCKNEWPSDYQMEEYCRKQQLDGLRSLNARIASYKSSGGKPEVLEAILRKCGEDWYNATAQTNDYQMWDYCVKQQVEAAKRMGY